MDTVDMKLQRSIQIEECLLTLMGSVPYSQITVAELCLQLGIARKTFYYYYTGKEDCLNSAVTRKIRESALCTTTAAITSDDRQQTYRVNLQYWKEQKAFLDALTKNKLEWLFMKSCMHHVQEEEKQLQSLLTTSTVEFDSDILTFYICGQISIMLQWYLRGFDSPVEEMVQKYLRLMHMPLLSPEGQGNHFSDSSRM